MMNNTNEIYSDNLRGMDVAVETYSRETDLGH